MKQVFEIPGTLPNENDIIKAAKASNPRNHFKPISDMKEANDNAVMWAAKAAHIKPVAGKVNVRIHWVEPNMKRDKDNIHAGTKFIFDGLVKLGILKNDGWTWIGDLSYRYSVNRANPRVIVELEEA